MRRPLVLLCAALWLICVLVAPPPRADEKGKQDTKTKTYTNEDLPPVSDAARTPHPAPTQTAAPPADSPIPSYDDMRDENGHGEGWWRLRANELDAKILEARYEAQRLHVGYVKGNRLVDPRLPARSREATARLLELEAERDGLPEELRRAGGPASWLWPCGRSLPAKPLPSPKPGAAAHGAGAVTLSWDPVPDGTFYLVEVECLDCCGFREDCGVTSLDVTKTTARLPLEAGHSGRWRVRALDAAGRPGAWTGWQALEPRGVEVPSTVPSRVEP